MIERAYLSVWSSVLWRMSAIHVAAGACQNKSPCYGMAIRVVLHATFPITSSIFRRICPQISAPCTPIGTLHFAGSCHHPDHAPGSPKNAHSVQRIAVVGVRPIETRKVALWPCNQYLRGPFVCAGVRRGSGVGCLGTVGSAQNRQRPSPGLPRLHVKLLPRVFAHPEPESTSYGPVLKP